MALPTPNTDPRKGRMTTTTSGAGAAETNEMNRGLKDVENVIVEQLSMMSGFLEIGKNYFPKLGFIEKNTEVTQQRLYRLSKPIERMDKNMAKLVEGLGYKEKEEDADQLDPNEEPIDDGAPVDGGGEGEEDDAKPVLERIADDTSAILKIMQDAGEDKREGLGDDGSGGDSGTDGADGEEKKQEGMFAPIGKFFKSLFKKLKLIFVGLLLVVAPLLTAGADLFSAIKQLFDQVFQALTQIIGVIMERVVPVIVEIMTKVIEIITALLPPVMEIIMVVVDVIMQLVEALLPPIMAIVDLVMDLILAIVPPIMDIVQALLDAIMPIITMLIDMLVPIIEIVADLLMFIFDILLKPLLMLLVPIVEFVGDLVMGFFNMFIAVWNGIIEAAAFLAGFFGAGDEVRSLKVDYLEKDESKDAAQNIDFSQDDEAIDAQIQAKLDSGEINKTTAEALMADKEKFRDQQQARRDELVSKIKVEQVETPAALQEDGKKLNLVSLTLPEDLGGTTVLVDPDSKDEDGNYDLYSEDGRVLPNPAQFFGKSAQAKVMGVIGAAIEGIDDGGGGIDMSNIGAAFSADESITVGQDLADDTLDLGEEQADAAGGSGDTTTVSASTATNIQNQTSTSVTNVSTGDRSPNAGRGFSLVPN